MKRELQKSSAFARALKKTLKRDPRLTIEIEEALALLSNDAFDPRLRTHKLRGKLEDSWACSAGYDLRIIFSFVSGRSRSRSSRNDWNTRGSLLTTTAS